MLSNINQRGPTDTDPSIGWQLLAPASSGWSSVFPHGSSQRRMAALEQEKS